MIYTDEQLKAKITEMIRIFETEAVEFKSATSNFSFSEIGKYFSALSNEANLRSLREAWLIFGVTNQKEIRGTSYRKDKQGGSLQSLKKEIAASTNERLTFLEIYETELEGLAVDKVYAKIRNERYRYIAGQQTLFPEEVDQYEPGLIKEILNNCIAHSDSVFSLNADWGEGKTFFTLQAKMILEYFNPNCKQVENIKARLDSLFTLAGTAMRKPEMTRTIFPVYYNAWLYDDHKDPLSSFLYFLSVTFQKKYSKLDSNGLKKLGCALNIITTWKRGFAVELEEIGEAVAGKDTSAKIEYLEDAKLLVDEAFHDLLEGNDGLVVFVDEIDRCSPRYAVDFLECIKHFFGCSNVQFVFSTNIKQLAETICNVYGAGFDGTRYLNKFFDCPLELPPADTSCVLRNINAMQTAGFVESFAQSLMKSLHLSIREANDFYGQAPGIASRCHNVIRNNWFRPSDNFAYACYPIMLFALSLVDRKKYDSFKNGSGEKLFLDLLFQWRDWRALAYRTLLKDSRDQTLEDSILAEAISADYKRIFCSETAQDIEVSELRQSVLALSSLIG